MPPYPRDGLSILTERSATRCSRDARRSCGPGLLGPAVHDHAPSRGPPDIDARTSSTASYAAAFDRRARVGRSRRRDVLSRARHRRASAPTTGSSTARMTASRQAAARQRPASGRADAVDLVSRAHRPPATSTSSARRCPARRPSRSGVTASSPGAQPTSARTSRICIARRSTRPGTLCRIPRRAGAAADHPRNDSASKAPRPSSSTSAFRDMVRWCPTRSTPSTRTSATTPRPPRSSRSRSAGRRSTATTQRSASYLELNEARNWSEFTRRSRLRRAPSQNFVYADVDGHIGYYAPGRIPIRARGDGAHAGRRLDRRRRMDRLGSVRRSCHTPSIRPNTSSSPPIIGPAPPTIHTCSASTGPSRTARSASSIAGGQDRGCTPTISRRCRRTRSSLHARRCCRCFWRTRTRYAAPTRQQLRCCAAGICDARGKQRRGRDFRGLVFAARARASSATTSVRSSTESYAGALFSHHALFRRHAHDQRQSVVRRRPDAGAGNLRRRGDACAASRPSTDLDARLGSDMTRWRWDRRSPRRVSASGLDARRAAAGASQPLGAQRRRLEHGQRRPGRPPSIRSSSTRCPATARSSISRRPTTAGLAAPSVSPGTSLSPHYDDFLAGLACSPPAEDADRPREIEHGALGRIRLMPRNAG